MENCQTEKKSLTENYEASFMVQYLESMLETSSYGIIVMCSTHLRLLLDKLELFSKNKYIVTHVKFEQELRGVLDNVRKSRLLNVDLNNSVFTVSFVNSVIGNESMEKKILLI